MLAFLFFTAIACSDDKDTIQKKLRVSSSELVFSHKGDALILKVISENVEWKYTSDDWVDCSVVAQSPNEILVKVDRWYKAEFRMGKIKIESLDPEIPSIKVLVTQFGVDLPTLIWDRTTIQRMNLHGQIAKLSYFDVLSRDGAAIYDLEFSKSGMLTQFTHKKNNNKSVTINLIYDDVNRLTSIKGFGSEDDYEFNLSYGDHARFIPTEEVFNDLSSNSGKVINHTVWMPLLMKNLSKITFTDKLNGSNSMECVAKIEGVKGTMSFGSKSDYYTYTFEGSYVKTISFEIWFNSVVKTYFINDSNGVILKTNEVDSSGSIAIDFNDDLLNSIKGMVSTFTGQDSFEYNNNCDVIKQTKDGTIYATRDYEYDKEGNWIVANDTKQGEIKREISYRE